MKRSTLLGFSVLFASLASLAQNPGAPVPNPGTHAQIIMLPSVQTDSACPVAMRARHDFFFQKELVKGEKPNEKGTEGQDASTQLRLTLTNFDHRQIQSANITVRGTNANWRLTPVEAHNGSANVTRTMNASFEPTEESGVDSYLSLHGFTTITAIVLNSVTYADGSTWKTVDAGACQVAPDPLMLISGR
jgi:hypothetical protein